VKREPVFATERRMQTPWFMKPLLKILLFLVPFLREGDKSGWKVRRSMQHKIPDS
jgi:hypothetical protein